MSKKIIFDGKFPRFSEDGPYETDLETNRVDRFYLENDLLQDKYVGKTDLQILELDKAAHEELLAANAAQNAALMAELGQSNNQE